jgi:hypothetical protein
MNKLFTFIVEHDGASSVSQIEASDVKWAFNSWRRDLSRHLGEILAASDIAALGSSLEADYPTPLNERANVWFACGHTMSALARINIVQTERSQ